MASDFWKPPSWSLDLDQISVIEAFRVPDKSIISDEGWPDSFWSNVQERTTANEKESKALLNLFRGLEVSEPARCHMPPFGLAGYLPDGTLSFTVTLCFECSNAYVYTVDGKQLRAFDISTTHAKNLLKTLKDHFKC